MPNSDVYTNDPNDRAWIQDNLNPETVEVQTGKHRQTVAAIDIYDHIALGDITGYSKVNKYGHAPSGIQVTYTDIWSRADATPTQQLWLAPTAARIHAIVSSSADDDAAGIGAVSVTVYGLVNWDTAESSEVVVLDGTTPVNTANSYVIIHRMVANAQATTTNAGINAGVISATAASDSTITAIIAVDTTPTPDVGDGQTEMAIYGIPSTQTAILKSWRAHLNKAQGTAVSANFELRYNPNPDVQTVGFIRRSDMSLQSTGVSSENFKFDVPPVFVGPGILKVTATATIADTEGGSQFDLVLVNN